jgi:dihydrofolate synthase/folylpolyglutamate synthase
MLDSDNFRSASYRAASDFLYGRINYERAPGGPPRGRGLKLARMRELLARIGDPQRQFPAVHIAGTKGKGSTATMLAAVLKAAGYRTALYCSPHLEHLEERIQIGGQPCTPDELVGLTDAVRPAIASLDEEAERDGSLGPPTFFEITTAMAMLHFARQQVGAAVLEVGLGGRLDSTNVCQPAVTAITSISFDHVRQLGNTLGKIAAEKAGIIKPGVPVVCGVTAEEPREVIRRIAAERAAPACFVGEDFDFQHHPPSRFGLEPDVLHFAGNLGVGKLGAGKPGENGRLRDVQLGMAGSHQAANAAVAIATLQQLQHAGWRIPERAIYRGLAEARSPARIEVVSRAPTVVLDTAHNPASIDALMTTLGAPFGIGRRILIFAATRDKDVSGMLKRLRHGFDFIILTQYLNNPRCLAPTDARRMLEQVLCDSGASPMPTITTCETPALAWRHCETIATPEDLVCITGSFFLAAEMRSLIAGTRPLSTTVP